MNRLMKVLAVMLGLVLIAGCSDSGELDPDNPESNANDQGAQSSKQTGYVLAELPRVEEAYQIGVGDLIDSKPEAGKTYVVEGRIQEVSKGYHSLRVVDANNVQYCHPDEGCPTPWDYCCTPPDDLSKNMIVVRLVDGDSDEPAKADAEKAREYRHLDLVKFVGTFVEAEGGWRLLATGYQRVERPEIPADVVFPETVTGKVQK